MARLFASYGFDYSTLNLNFLVSKQTDFEFLNNEYYKYHSITYEDIAVFEWYSGGYVKSYFAGSGFRFDSDGDVTGGTVKGYLEEFRTGSKWVTDWGIERFSYSAIRMADAAMTASRTDDYVIIEYILRGDDTFDLSNSADKARGYSGNDKIYGNGGKDVLYGDAGSDMLYGHTGNDLLSGGSGNDTLQGGSQSDTLIGGSGADKLYGGSDNVRDIFDFNNISESKRGSSYHDRIYNFKSGIDDVDLRTIDANMRSAGDQAFKFGGTSKTAYGVWYTKSGSDVMVYGDVNGDKVADFEIQLVGVSKLVSGDLVL